MSSVRAMSKNERGEGSGFVGTGMETLQIRAAKHPNFRRGCSEGDVLQLQSDRQPWLSGYYRVMSSEEYSHVETRTTIIEMVIARFRFGDGMRVRGIRIEEAS